MAKKKRTVVVQAKKKKQAATKRQMTILGSALRSLGGLGGGAAGTMLGFPAAGASLGSSLGASLSKWLGSGDYSVQSNSIVNSMKASGSIPSMHQNDQTIIVRHKEYIMEVRSATSFTVLNSLPINPGMSQTFPWLSRLANNYQQYRIRGMVYHYVPTSGSAISGTNNALGSVMLQTSYRSTDTLPGSKVELLNEYWATECVPSETQAHPIECNPAENPFNVQYIRGTEVPTTENQLMYDLGVTHVAVSGQQAAGVVLGDLWVTYEIELKKPIIASNVTTNAFRQSLLFKNTGTDFPFGVSTQIGEIGLATNGYTITLPRGSLGIFYIIARMSGPFTGACGWTSSATLTNCSIVLIDQVNNRFETAATAPASMYYALCVLKGDQSTQATVTLPTATIGGGTISSASLLVLNRHGVV
jgi:hypothetical protein